MKILLVDDEAQVLRGVSRMIESEVADWEVETALSGKGALEMLEEDEFNVVVTDMRMPGMDGSQLLDAVELRFPQVLRVVLSGQADRETVLQAIRPMHQYLSKPCDPQKLIDIIRRAEVFQQTISSTEILSAIGRANCLPSLPTIVTQFNSSLESNSSTSASLAKVVMQDPMLCAKILQLANSAIFGLRQPVVAVERALSVLGSEITRALALSLSVFSSERESTATTTRQLFTHSIEVARISRLIAGWENTDASTINTACSGGLLHDIGKMVLLNAFEERYGGLITRSAHQGVWEVELEMQEFGASHAGVGAYLLETWGLPTEIVQAVGSHHSLDLCSRSGLICQIVFGANWIAHGSTDSDLLSGSNSTTEAFCKRLSQWKAMYLEAVMEDSNA
ncbi:response regulator [Stieleria varia]|uniref:Hydrogenase transcriptional regulatory protein hupR1 n=1 Tax=Stieleria varia TaxID=2528005 RepID=A0A5C6B3E1_9BACT|nr:response regulator [Stieleria varia]TWU06420.1 Hydrogenase transcriptional regulatory protein hupR1 [Stieleria varia]